MRDEIISIKINIPVDTIRKMYSIIEMYKIKGNSRKK